MPSLGDLQSGFWRVRKWTTPIARLLFNSICFSLQVPLTSIDIFSVTVNYPFHAVLTLVKSCALMLHKNGPLVVTGTGIEG